MVKNKLNIIKSYELFFTLVILITFNACDIVSDIPRNENVSIPVYKLNINNEAYGTFVTNEFSDLSVNGKLNYNNKKFNVSIEHHGFSSRGLFKKNYTLEFESSDPILNRKKVILSAQATDKSMLRYFLSNEIFKEAGLKTAVITPVYFYINEESQGLYYLIEQINEEFFYKRNINVGELYKAINGEAKFNFNDNKELRNGFEKKIPEDDNYYTLEKLIVTIDNEPESTFQTKIESMFNVDAYLKYMAVSVMICNWDGIVHNFNIYRDNSNGKYEIIPWDLDATFYFEDNLTAFPGNSPLLLKLLRHDKYRTEYKKYFEEYLNGCFSQEFVNSKIDQMKNIIVKAYSEDKWLNATGYNLNVESDNIKTFVQQRRLYLQDKLNDF